MAYDPNFMGPPTAGDQFTGVVGSMLRGGTSLSGGMGVLGNMASQGATGFASMLAGLNPATAIMAGLSSALGAREERKAQDKNLRWNLRTVRSQGDEQRKTALYQTLLGDWKERKDKFRKSQGLANYRAYAQQSGTVKPGSNTERMLNFQSPNRVQDPGAAPSPLPLFTNDWSKKKKERTSYNVLDNGQLERIQDDPSVMRRSAIRPGG